MSYITSSRYCNLLQEYVITTLRQRQRLETTVFMQDGAQPHIARQVIALLRAHFGDERSILKSFPTAWPFHFMDINFFDFWLWGFL